MKIGHISRTLDADDQDGEEPRVLIHLATSTFALHLELPEVRDENTKKLDHDGCRNVWHHTQRKDRSITERTTGEHIQEAYKTL